MHAGAKDNLDRAPDSSRRGAGRRVSIQLALAGSVAALAAGFWLIAPDDSLDSIHRDGVIRIGYAVEPPYAFLEPDGTVTGKSPEVEMAGPFTNTGDGTPREPDRGALAFRRRDRALRRAWDAQLQSDLPSEEHRRLMGRFGFTAAELPDPSASPEVNRP